MFIVYYDHGKNTQFLSALGSILPEIPLVDLYAGANNTKIAHAKAWLTTGPSSYVTIEITFGASQGVHRQKEIKFKYGGKSGKLMQ